MTHITQSVKNPDMVWATDKIGELILIDIWRKLQKSVLEDDFNLMLIIHVEERERAKKLFSEFGFTFNL